MAVIEYLLFAAGFSINVFIFWQNIDHAISQLITYISMVMIMTFKGAISTDC